MIMMTSNYSSVYDDDIVVTTVATQVILMKVIQTHPSTYLAHCQLTKHHYAISAVGDSKFI